MSRLGQSRVMRGMLHAKHFMRPRAISFAERRYSAPNGGQQDARLQSLLHLPDRPSRRITVTGRYVPETDIVRYDTLHRELNRSRLNGSYSPVRKAAQK